MTRRFFINLCVMVLTGAMMMSCVNDKRYSFYSSKKPALSFEWAVPHDWASEEFGEPQLGFAGVTFVDKKQGAKSYQANFTVTAKKAASFGLNPATLDAVADDTAKRCLKLPEARIAKRGAEKVALQEARVIEVVYQGLTKIFTPGSEKVLLRQRIVIVPHGDSFYIIRYTNEEKKFSEIEPVFRHALKIFRFLDLA